MSNYEEQKKAEEAAHLEWFRGLKPGDEVIYEWGRGATKVERIKSRTPGGKVRLENGDLFDSSCYLYRKGGGWGGSSLRIRPVTEEFLREKERSNLAYRLEQKVKWRELPLETLRELEALLNRPKELVELEFETNDDIREGEVCHGWLKEPGSTTYGMRKINVFVHKILSVSPMDMAAVTVRVLGEEVR